MIPSEPLHLDPSITSLPASSPSSASKNISTSAFAAQLQGAMTTKNKKNEKNAIEETIKNLSLKNLPQMDFSSSEVELLSQVLNNPEFDLNGLLKNIKEYFQAGIKNSLLKLENIVQNTSMEETQKNNFLKAIDNIKKDYSLGFGVDFDQVKIQSKIPDMDNILRALEEKKDSIPPSLFKKLENLFPSVQK